MMRPYCGYFWAVICSFWIAIGCISAIEIVAKDGMDWWDWVQAVVAIATHAYIIRLIWRP